MLRDFELNERIRLHTLHQCANQALHFAEPTHAAESAGRLMQSRTDPAKQHVAILPAFHVVRVVSNQAVEVFDRIGTAQRLVERTIDAKGGDGEGLFESLTQARAGARMGAGEGPGEAFELSPGKRHVFALPSIA